MSGLGRFYQLDVRCRGPLKPVYGYLVDIQEIDRAARATLIPALSHDCLTTPNLDPALALSLALPAFARALDGLVEAVRWHLSPFYSVEVPMTPGTTALVRHRFDFAAAHRLHVDRLSPEENRRLFGKCNSPNGHGHNYQVEPVIAVPIRPDGVPALPLDSLERIVTETVLARFDHKNLNQDTPEFGPSGVNPSVENIARVCYDLLGPALAASHPDASLRAVTVWESDRTSSTYPG